MDDKQYDQQRRLQRFPAQKARPAKDKAEQIVAQANCTRIPAHVVRLARRAKELPPVQEAPHNTPIQIVSQFFSNLLP